MATSFIPNQPILFQDPLFAGQTCLNADTRQYAQLAEADDNMCIQIINEPVATLYNCNLNVNPNDVVNGEFTSDLSNWTEYNFLSSVPSGTNYWTWSTSGATSDPSQSGIGLVQTIPGTIGNIYLISFEFQYDNGGDFNIGIGNSSTGIFVFNNLYNNYGKNIDGRRCIIVDSSFGLDVAFYCNTSDVKIKNIVARDITACQLVTLNGSLEHWTYVETLNGWEKLDGTAAVTWPLEILATLTNGTSYKFSYKITNMAEDDLAYFEFLDFDNNSIAKQFTNGEYVEYFTYTGTTGYMSLQGHPNAIYGVVYDIKLEEMCYDHRIAITYPDGSNASIWYDSASPVNPIQYYKDRIVWCFDWNSLEQFSPFGLPLDPGCYTITFDDQCTGGVTTQSYTVVNYKATGGHPCSLVVQGTNQGYAFGFFFNEPGINVNFVLKQRLRILQFNPMYPTKTEQYLYSNGDMFRSFAQSGKVRTAWFDYVDEPTHDVIRLQLLSDTLIVGPQPFFCVAEDYEPEWGENGKYNLAQSKVTLMAVNEPTLYNKNCL
jgi:hypothetical protein